MICSQPVGAQIASKADAPKKSKEPANNALGMNAPAETDSR
jgi:hypothetical protein